MQKCTLKNKQFCFVKDPDLDLLIGSGSEKKIVRIRNSV